MLGLAWLSRRPGEFKKSMPARSLSALPPLPPAAAVSDIIGVGTRNGTYARKPGFDGKLFGAEDGALWHDDQSDSFHFLVHVSCHGQPANRSLKSPSPARPHSHAVTHRHVHRITHTLLQNFPGGHNTGNDTEAAAGVGGHAYSQDGLRWTYSDKPAYTTAVQIGGPGSSGQLLYRRERPKVSA